MSKYYSERLVEGQTIVETGSIHYAGTLSVRTYFNKRDDSLFVEVIGARNILALDTNGLSDPFVVVDLLPHSRFPQALAKETHVHRGTLNPVFDECLVL